jgi:hypothetical protein
MVSNMTWCSFWGGSNGADSVGEEASRHERRREWCRRIGGAGDELDTRPPRGGDPGQAVDPARGRFIRRSLGQFVSGAGKVSGDPLE